MSVGLDKMISMVPQDANIAAAESVGRMAELGLIDTEFTVYGAAFLGEDGQMKYVISSEAEKIYRFCDDLKMKSCYTPMQSYTDVRPVPAGYKEDIAKQVKHRLGKQLQATFPRDVLVGINQFLQAPPSDAGFAVLEAYQKRIADVFARDYLQIFQELVALAYSKKLLTERSYRYFDDWSKGILRQMENDLVVRDYFQKTLYNFVDQSAEGKLKYYSNAQYRSAYKARQEAELAGHVVSPIFAKTYQYNYTKKLAHVKEENQTVLAALFDDVYVKTLQDIYQLPSAIAMTKADFYQAFGNQDALAVQDLIRSYALRWNVV